MPSATAVRPAALTAIDPSAPGEALAVLRPGQTLLVAPLAPAAFALAKALTDGRCLADALADLSPEAASPALTELLELGLFAGVDNQSNQRS